jgi:hypothetical protein
MIRRPVAARTVRALALVLAPALSAFGGDGRPPRAGPFLQATAAGGAVRLAGGGIAAPILVDADDHPGVRRAARDLQEDVVRVTGLRPDLVTAEPSTADVVVVGTIGRSRTIDRLVRTGRLHVTEIRGRWEASVAEVVVRPWPGVERALVIAGSDPRGTIFGVYDVSERIGVSPWYWWADVPVRKSDRLFVAPGRWVRREPVVRYRGLFINDEAPALSGWARERFGGFNAKFYAHVFELLLRLRANFLWPAMWGSAFADDDPASPALANEYGIVVGTSHHEPMMRAHDEWRRYGQGPWNYGTNAEALRAFWTEGLRRVGAFENVVTLGMRGDGDAPMERQANVALLERIVADQRALLARDARWSAAPQVWALYKEVQEYYEKGMRVPDDVTLLWCDDNWGNIRRLPTAEERDRPGGAGVYYHFDYVGGPRSYKWINTTPIPKVGEQMHLAWRHGATRLWIVNVGDIKPMELPISFFLEYAWDPAAWPLERMNDFGSVWAERLFGPDHAAAIGGMLARHTRLLSRRKPEMLEPGTYSLVHYGEAEAVVREAHRLRTEAESLHARLPAEQRAAFFQLVLHPLKASALLHDLYATVGRNRLHAVQGRSSTNALAQRARALFQQDADLSREYNETLSDGKWTHLMDQTHIGYTYWNQPVRNALPGVQEVQVPPAAEMGVAVEGSEASWPGAAVQPTLPALNPFDGATRAIEVFNRGREPFSYEAVPADAWLTVDAPRGPVGEDRTVRVGARWAEVPAGVTGSSVTIRGPAGASVTVQVPLFRPAPPPATFAGFVETNGTVAIEAEHHANAVAPRGREWKTIPGHGRTLSGVTPWPVTEAAAPATMRLEYPVHLFHDGPVEVAVHLAPTQKFQPGPGLRFAVSFDDQPPQVVNVHADESPAAWARSVSDGVTIATSRHTVAPGPHVLKVHALDAGLVFQRIVVDAGGLKPSYLGPPESPRLGPVRPTRPGS